MSEDNPVLVISILVCAIVAALLFGFRDTGSSVPKPKPTQLDKDAWALKEAADGM